jgi:hypothetical protein
LIYFCGLRGGLLYCISQWETGGLDLLSFARLLAGQSCGGKDQICAPGCAECFLCVLCAQSSRHLTLMKMGTCSSVLLFCASEVSSRAAATQSASYKYVFCVPPVDLCPGF